jgi:hypothetical protein
MKCNIKGALCENIKCPCNADHEQHSKCGKHACYKIDRGVIIKQRCEEKDK